MCTSQEVLDTIVWPTLTLQSWVRPSFQGYGAEALDASGVSTLTPLFMSCNGWDSDGSTGLMVNPSGGFKAYDLTTNRCGDPKPVACCRRVPEPTASLMLPVGGLACLGLAKARS